MSKRVLWMILLSLSLLLTACGFNSSWEEDEIKEVSNRIITDDVNVEWMLDSKRSSDRGSLIRLRVSNNGKPINDFEINHEKLLHLIIVSKDLAYFTHIHPEYKGKGVFEIMNRFPTGGEYRMVADFKPKNGSSMSKMEWITIKGKTVHPVAVTVDKSFVKTVDDKKVSLSIEPKLQSRQEVTLTFKFTDEGTKKPITDLESYLGSIGHVVTLSENGERYLHVHALEDQGSGPVALFETEFPESGVYKIWGQFQKDGQVFTVPYVVNVP